MQVKVMMKHRFILLLFLVFVPHFFGQKPSASPTPTQSAPPEQPRIRNFGSSLKRYGKKERHNTSAKSNESDDDVVRVSTDLVVNDVLVSNQKGNVILGLQKEDFVVTEDGMPQTVEMFASGESGTVPRSVVLIIDCLAPQAPYLKSSIAASKILVDKLAPHDKMAIVTVDLKLQLDFTSDKIVLKETLDSLEKKDVEIWGGWQFSSLLAVLNEMFNEQDRQRMVVFQGSGNEIIWLKPDKDTPYQVSYSTLERSGLRYTRASSLPKFGFSEVKEAIESSRATIYSVIPGIRFLGLSKKEQVARAKLSIVERNKFFKGDKESSLPMIVGYYQYAVAERNTAGQTAMYKVAELSGGFTSFIEKPEDAENVYSDIFTVIKNRYVMGYYPTNRNRDGKRRQVTIQVRNHPEFIVTGRKTYFLQ
jgi:VWFA-related protein